MQQAWRGGAIGRALDQRPRLLELAGSILAVPLSHSDHRQVIHMHVPLFTKQYKLVVAKGDDALKLGR